MEYQLLCVDLDGTLLNDKKQLPAENAAALYQAWEAGMEICIASGRGAESAGEYLKEMKITGSVAALNGGMVVCHGKEIYRAGMNPEVVEQVVDIVEEMKVIGFFNDGEGTLAVNEDEAAARRRLQGNPACLKTYHPETAKTLMEKVKNGHTIVKISIREDDPNRLEMIRERILDTVKAQVAKSDVNYLDIFSYGQSKWTGIEKLLKHLGISAESCVCFGDNENDREMIERAGLGITMANAEMDLKTRADFVTASNKENGVAYGIRTWVLGKPDGF